MCAPSVHHTPVSSSRSCSHFHCFSLRCTVGRIERRRSELKIRRLDREVRVSRLDQVDQVDATGRVASRPARPCVSTCLLTAVVTVVVALRLGEQRFGQVVPVEPVALAAAGRWRRTHWRARRHCRMTASAATARASPSVRSAALAPLLLVMAAPLRTGSRRPDRSGAVGSDGGSGFAVGDDRARIVGTSYARPCPCL